MTWPALRMTILATLCLAAAACEATTPVAGKLCKGDLPEPCNGSGEKWACVAARWQTIPCRGPQGCGVALGQCDTSVGRVGDACLANVHQEACSEDGAEVLACEGGKLVPARACHGPKRCAAKPGNRPECDGTVGVLGEPCKLLEARSAACSVDHKAVLECASPPTGMRFHGTSDRVYTAIRDCPTPAGCKQGGNWAYCDFTGATVGTPCGKGNEDRLFCSPDRKAVLRCNATTLVLEMERACKKDLCQVDDADGRTNGGCPR